MLNQVVLVGRIVRDPEIKKLENGKKVSNITLAVPRSYKNSEGEYATDFINVTLWNSVAENTAEYCQIGDMVGVKGKLETNTYEKDNQRHTSLGVIAERVTFLAQSKENKEKTDFDER